MSVSAGQTFRILVGESLADSIRRRIVPVIVLMALISLFFVDSCASCSPTVVRDGAEVQVDQLSGIAGVVAVVGLGLWALVLAGVLASDHLAEPLSDGSASLVLARPVSRASFALTRLAGPLILTAFTAALLVGGAGMRFAVQHELSVMPIAIAFLACLVNATTIAGFAMAASLWLPRTLIALIVFAIVWGIAGVETTLYFAEEVGGLAGAVGRFGPPFAGSMVAPLADWLELETSAGSPPALAARALVWAGLGVATLIAVFRRTELR